MTRRGADWFSKIRQVGRRLQGGPWILIVSRASGASERRVVALGRRSGSAVTRSRARRIARECLWAWGAGQAGTDVLLMIRGDVGQIPRRDLRGSLLRLLRRAEPAPPARGN